MIAIVLAVLTVVLVNTGSTAEPARTLSLRDYSPTEVLYSSNVTTVDWGVNDSYIELIESVDSSVNNSQESVNCALVQVGRNNVNNYHKQFVVAAEFNASNLSEVSLLNGMYSSIVFHAAPVSLNLLTNAVLKAKDQNKSITVINHPLEAKQVRS